MLYDYYGDDTTYALAHFGILGMKWGVRRYQNPDGTLTKAGRDRYKSSVREMSNEDLEKAITRLSNEKRYLELSESVRPKNGYKRALDTIDNTRRTFGPILGPIFKPVGNAYQTLATEVLVKGGKSLLAIGDENAKMAREIERLERDVKLRELDIKKREIDDKKGRMAETRRSVTDPDDNRTYNVYSIFDKNFKGTVTLDQVKKAVESGSITEDELKKWLKGNDD